MSAGSMFEEVKYLHYQLFRRLPESNIIDYYIRAHTEIQELSKLNEQELQTVQFIVTHGLDAVGIEPWLRNKKLRHALSVKLLLLTYLAECDTKHSEFCRNNPSKKVAILEMGCAVFFAALRLIRGFIQKVRYGLI
ncbi:TPA: hypothetical protein U5E24_003945 [Yersinia enterocolitica]|nr:hypothetical protein [Yersinia enterocolitica]HEN3569036.1 hypothetical protein [Yersinia enterocolitica]HEN3573654.1 hypothetical protein [Yersinia enterocolitica]HEN3648620.1 hypothetical protein [Yersinia enterocolitica]HEN3660088.1 hypothetical protein [Yersinia enterocolitica]